MIDDVGGAAFIAMLIAMLMLFMWALAEAAQRKDLENRLKDLERDYRKIRRQRDVMHVNTDMIEKLFKEKL
jgi:cell division FtsZ-interacting protein ZapD